MLKNTAEKLKTVLDEIVQAMTFIQDGPPKFPYFHFVNNSVGGVYEHVDQHNDFGWVTMAAYLADIFIAMNKLNLGL